MTTDEELVEARTISSHLVIQAMDDNPSSHIPRYFVLDSETYIDVLKGTGAELRQTPGNNRDYRVYKGNIFVKRNS